MKRKFRFNRPAIDLYTAVHASKRCVDSRVVVAEVSAEKSVKCLMLFVPPVARLRKCRFAQQKAVRYIAGNISSAVSNLA